jgi:hypothetical protein
MAGTFPDSLGTLTRITTGLIWENENWLTSETLPLTLTKSQEKLTN